MDPAAAFLVPPSLHVVALLLSEDGVTIRAVSEATGVCCPVCGGSAERIHSRSTRTLFAERPAGIAPACAHRTDRQRERLTDFALALGGPVPVNNARKALRRSSPAP